MEDSIVVIQCAASKQSFAGHLHSGDGRRVMFVANPSLSPANHDCIYAHPDDPAGSGLSWREELLQYNRHPDDNPLGLSPAWRLYKNRIYKRLYRKCGPDNLYILSAGWGLMHADFLTPNYDITFSNNAEKYKRRGRRDGYHDCQILPDETGKPVIFFGGKDYVRLFCKLTEQAQGVRLVFYNSVSLPDAPGCELRKFETNVKTNWHYAAAQAYVDGRISI